MYFLNTKMNKIIVDHREHKNIKLELTKEGLELDIRQLGIADFVLQTKDLDNKIQNVGIERKTVNDLLNSIIDRRLLNQLIILKQNFDIPLLIIEGEENVYRLRNFHPNSIRGIMATIAIDFQIPIIYSRGFKDTAKYISLIAKRLEKTRKPLSLLPKRKTLSLKDSQLAVIESFPGVGSTIAKSLIKNFGSIANIVNADVNELQNVEKIGKIKARELKKLFEESFSQ